MLPNLRQGQLFSSAFLLSLRLLLLLLILDPLPKDEGSPPQKTKQRGAENVDAGRHQRRRGQRLDGGRQGGQPRRHIGRHTGRHGRADVRHCGGDGRTQAFEDEDEGEGRVGRRADRQHHGGGGTGGGLAGIGLLSGGIEAARSGSHS